MQLWPLIPTMAGAYLITSLLPSSLGNTLITLAFRASFTALVAVLIHGLCTRFRFFQEATGVIMQKPSPRSQLPTTITSRRQTYLA